MVTKTITRKKKQEKQELLNLLRESDTTKEQEFNIQYIIDQTEAIDISKLYEEIVKARKKKQRTIILNCLRSFAVVM